MAEKKVTYTLRCRGCNQPIALTSKRYLKYVGMAGPCCGECNRVRHAIVDWSEFDRLVAKGDNDEDERENREAENNGEQSRGSDL